MLMRELPNGGCKNALDQEEEIATLAIHVTDSAVAPYRAMPCMAPSLQTAFNFEGTILTQ